LVTGASGTVGKEVVYQLLELPDNFDVSVFDLKTKSAEKFFGQFKGYYSAAKIFSIRIVNYHKISR